MILFALLAIALGWVLERVMRTGAGDRQDTTRHRVPQQRTRR